LDLGGNKKNLVSSPPEAEWTVISRGEPHVPVVLGFVPDALGQFSGVGDVVSLLGIPVKRSNIDGGFWKLVQEDISVGRDGDVAPKGLGYVEGHGEGALAVGSGAGDDLRDDWGGHGNLLLFVVGARDVVEELHEHVVVRGVHADMSGTDPPAARVGSQLIHIPFGAIEVELRALEALGLAVLDRGAGFYLPGGANGDTSGENEQQLHVQLWG